ncbi:MAG: hypothetical protein IJ148_01270 [Bacteroidaceae bacterium]|nr:hypothetical protein [Bacteroidaceae bacterium]MBQ9169441.1 hypothetical protein [Bacteroidaceae bacterium]
MRKTYSKPAYMVVELGTMQMMAESMEIDSTNLIDNPDEILVKEDKTLSDVNLWNNEW